MLNELLPMLGGPETFTEKNFCPMNTVCMCDGNVARGWVGVGVVTRQSSMPKAQSPPKVSEAALLKVTTVPYMGPVEGHRFVVIYEAFSTGKRTCEAFVTPHYTSCALTGSTG